MYGYHGLFPPVSQDRVGYRAYNHSYYQITENSLHCREACKIFDKRLMRPLYFRFGAYFEIIELLTILVSDVDSGSLGLKKGKDQMDVFNNLAVAYSRLGQSRLAMHYNSLAVELADIFGNKKSRIINRTNLANEQICLGKFREAERILQHRIEGKEDAFANISLHEAKGVLSAYKGDFTNASLELNTSLKLINKREAKSQQFQSKCVLYAERSKLYLLRNMPEDALKFASQSLDFCLKPKDEGESFESDFIRAQWLIGVSLVNLANYRNDKKNEFLDQAKIHLREALIRCRNVNLAVFEPAILLAWAKWHYASSDFGMAGIMAEDALNLADRCEYRLYQAEIHNFLAQLALSGNDPEKANEHAQIAFERALCDNPPHCYKPALSDAKSILEGLSKGSKT